MPPQHFRNLPVQIHLLRTQIWNLGNRAPIEESIKATLNRIQRYRSDQATTGHARVHRSRREVDDIIEANEPIQSSSSPGSRRPDITMLLTESGEVEFLEKVDHLAIPGSICTPRGTAVIRVSIQDDDFTALLDLVIFKRLDYIY